MPEHYGLNFLRIFLEKLMMQCLRERRNAVSQKKDANMEQNFELVGMMIGHSILQGGPGFSCLCPPAFNYLLYGDKERALECLPSLEDIPQNAATVSTIDLNSEVCKNVVCVILTSLFGFIEWDL